MKKMVEISISKLVFQYGYIVELKPMFIYVCQAPP